MSVGGYYLFATTNHSLLVRYYSLLVLGLGVICWCVCLTASRSVVQPAARSSGRPARQWLGQSVGQHICLYIYIYIYIQRERDSERERKRLCYIGRLCYINVPVYVYIYIYIYIQPVGGSADRRSAARQSAGRLSALFEHYIMGSY